MTLTEIAEFGKDCLKEYNGRLNVKGIAAYDASRVEAVRSEKPIEHPLSRLTPEIVRPAVVEVLEKLTNVGGFVMSEPRDEISDVETESSRYKNLSITFEYGHDRKANPFLWIFCWYYPATRQ